MAAVVTIYPDADELGDRLAREILDGIERARSASRRFLLGCPGGRSLLSTYQGLARRTRDTRADLAHLVIVMMDEYVVPSGDGFRYCPADLHYSCRRFAEHEIRGRLNDAIPFGGRIPLITFGCPTRPIRGRSTRVGGRWWGRSVPVGERCFGWSRRLQSPGNGDRQRVAGRSPGGDDPPRQSCDLPGVRGARGGPDARCIGRARHDRSAFDVGGHGAEWRAQAGGGASTPVRSGLHPRLARDHRPCLPQRAHRLGRGCSSNLASARLRVTGRAPAHWDAGLGNKLLRGDPGARRHLFVRHN